MGRASVDHAILTAAEAAREIASIRRSRGLTLQQLADRAGVPRSDLAAAEAGRRELRLDVCASVLAAMGCCLVYSMHGEAERP